MQIKFLFILSFIIYNNKIEAQLPRNVIINGKNFINSRNKEQIVLNGPNVVVKGPPYLPYVSGEKACNDTVNDYCSSFGNCTSCTTFNHADVKNLLKNGWNTIRLGIVWAGAQPKDEEKLDDKFLENLHKILNLTDFYNINVILDNHGDMVGSQGCGNGVPTWFQKKAAGELFGLPLETAFPYNLWMNIKNLEGYSYCKDNSTKWREYSGNPNYNILNECCLKINSNNPGAIGFSTINQKTINYLFSNKDGRKDFTRFWRLIAESVKDHPSAFMAELMNEPVSLFRNDMYETWKECALEINKILPDMSVSISDSLQGSYLPRWLTWMFPFFDISSENTKWIRNSKNLVYTFHWYGFPSKQKTAIDNALAIQEAWNVPLFSTEFMDCEFWKLAREKNISTTYWHYSSYCNTGPSFGNRKVPDETFGACILGWGGGASFDYCNNRK